MRYSRLTARDEVAVNAGSSLENVLSNQYRAKARRQIREKIERLLWLIFSLTTIWYGDGKTNLVTWLYNRYSAVRLLNIYPATRNSTQLFFIQNLVSSRSVRNLCKRDNPDVSHTST